MIHRSTPPAAFVVEEPTGDDVPEARPPTPEELRADGHAIPRGFARCAPWCPVCDPACFQADRENRHEAA